VGKKENKQCADILLNKSFKNLTFRRGFLFVGEMLMVPLPSSIISNEFKMYIRLVDQKYGHTIGHERT